MLGVRWPYPELVNPKLDFYLILFPVDCFQLMLVVMQNPGEWCLPLPKGPRWYSVRKDWCLPQYVLQRLQIRKRYWEGKREHDPLKSRQRQWGHKVHFCVIFLGLLQPNSINLVAKDSKHLFSHSSGARHWKSRYQQGPCFLSVL